MGRIEPQPPAAEPPDCETEPPVTAPETPNASANSEGAPSNAGSNTTKGVIFLTLFLDLVGFSIIFPLFPALLDHYLTADGVDGILARWVETLREWAGGADETENLWRVQTLFGGILGSVYSILQFGFSPLWGRWSDRIGRRPILLWTVAGITLAHGLWMISGSFGLFLIARVLGGAFSGNLSTASAAMADITDAKGRAAGMGIVGAAFGLGFILGPAIGGALWQWNMVDTFPGLAEYGFQPFSAAALGALLLSALNWIWIYRKFGETLPASKRGQEQQHRTASLLRLFRPRLGARVTRANTTYFIFLVAFSGMEFTLTFLVRDRFGWTPMVMAGMFVYLGVVIAGIQGGVVRRLAPKWGEPRLATVGLALVIPGLALLGVAATTGLVFWGGLTLMAIGSALAIPSLTSLVSRYAPEADQGLALGIFRSLGALARAVGPILAAVVYFLAGNAWPYYAGALILLLPLGLAARLAPPDDV